MRASRCLEARIVFISKLPSADTAATKSISGTFGLVAGNSAGLSYPSRKEKSARATLARRAESPASTKACICSIPTALRGNSRKKQNAQAKTCRIEIDGVQVLSKVVHRRGKVT